MATIGRLHFGRNYVCARCAHQARSFTSSAAFCAIAPESPRYIDFPQPPQQTKPDASRRKGVLPIPRHVLFKRGSPREILTRSLRDPKEPSRATDEADHSRRSRDAATSSSAPRLAFRSRMTELRKANLRQGYAQLSARHESAARQKKRVLQASRALDKTVLEAPQHHSDRFTETTLDESVRMELDRMASRKGKAGILPNPNWQSRFQESQRRVQAREQQKQEERRDALHTLYMNARSFIVDKEGLESAIDNAFGTDTAPKRFASDSGSRGASADLPSVWASGPPERMQDLVNATAGVASQRGKSNSGSVLRKRIKRMAEALTGGRMDG